MNPSVTRVLGASLALLGLFLAAIGAWFLTHVGTSGRAQFTAAPASPAIVIPETVLNNLATPVEVTIRADDGATVWAGTTTPSTADAIVAESTYVELAAVSVRPWQITTATRGSAELPSLASADVWRNIASGEQTASMTIDPDRAPEVLIAQASTGNIAVVELSWTRTAWFVQALSATVIGVMLMIAGALLVRRSMRALPADASVAHAGQSERDKPASEFDRAESERAEPASESEPDESDQNLPILTAPKETS